MLFIRLLPQGFTGLIARLRSDRPDMSWRGLPLSRLARRLDGPQSLGTSGWFWIPLGIAFAVAAGLSGLGGRIQRLQCGVPADLGLPCAERLHPWGFTGIFSFGQTAFFGIAGYAYGAIAVNVVSITGETGTAMLAAVLLAALTALAIGYIMFFGGVSALYVAIFTMMLTLLAETFANQTSGPRLSHRLGVARRLERDGRHSLAAYRLRRLVGGGDRRRPLLLRADPPRRCLSRPSLLINSSFGYVMVAAREDPQRTEMLGYDVRRVHLVVFVLGGALAGLSGGLFAAGTTSSRPPRWA